MLLFEKWMTFNVSICYYKKCVMRPCDEPGKYSCQEHSVVHHCRYICERWGPDPYLHRYEGYTCPTYSDGVTCEITCTMTGHVLEKGQPEYLANYQPSPPQNLFSCEDLHDYVLNMRTDDQAIGRLFDANNIEGLVCKFEWMHGQLSSTLQHIMMQLMINRESVRPIFRSENTHYYYIALFNVACEYTPSLARDQPPIKDNKYRRYTELKAFIKSIWKVMKPALRSTIVKSNNKALTKVQKPT